MENNIYIFIEPIIYKKYYKQYINYIVSNYLQDNKWLDKYYEKTDRPSIEELVDGFGVIINRHSLFFHNKYYSIIVVTDCHLSAVEIFRMEEENE